MSTGIVIDDGFGDTGDEVKEIGGDDTGACDGEAIAEVGNVVVVDCEKVAAGVGAVVSSDIGADAVGDDAKVGDGVGELLEDEHAPLNSNVISNIAIMSLLSSIH